MSNQANRFDKAPDRNHRRGVKKWRKELDKFGSTIIDQIPKELLADVIATRDEMSSLDLSQSSALTEALLKISPKRVGVNPIVELQLRMRQGGGNDAAGELPEMLSRLSTVYQPNSKKIVLGKKK